MIASRVLLRVPLYLAPTFRSVSCRNVSYALQSFKDSTTTSHKSHKPKTGQQTRSISSIVEVIQSGIAAYHVASGLPWWATFATSTLLVRFAMFPIIRQQAVVQQKFAAAMDDVTLLFKLYQEQPKADEQETQKRFEIFVAGVRAAFAEQNVRPISLLLYPVVNAAIFITFIYSIRTLIHSDDIMDISIGGMLWFEDLSRHDITRLLPLTALALTYYSINRSMFNPMMLKVKDFFQTGTILAFPVVAFLDAGVFFYWIPSTLFAIAQVTAFRNEKVLKLLGIEKYHPRDPPKYTDRPIKSLENV